MKKLINNPRGVSTYLNKLSGEVVHQNQKIWSLEELSQASLDNHLHNSFNYIPDPQTYRPVIGNLCPIHPKSSWILNGTDLQYFVHTVTAQEYETDLEKAARRYISAFDLTTTALEISGGLDTSLVYGYLKKYNKVPSLIGVVSDRYEFRTESAIQKIIMNNEQNSIILDENETFPFFEVKKTPFHTLPDKTSLFYAFYQKTKLNLSPDIHLLLSGVAGDALLAEKIENPSAHWMLNEWWAREHIFHPAGIDYRSVFSLYGVRRSLEGLRREFAEDPQKLWARSYFSEILPKELSQYAYKAAHDGIMYQGLTNAIDDIVELSSLTYSINKDQRLSPNSVYNLIKRWRDYRHNDLIEMLGIVSFCVWIWVTAKK